jgi:hypothetical protein
MYIANMEALYPLAHSIKINPADMFRIAEFVASVNSIIAEKVTFVEDGDMLVVTVGEKSTTIVHQNADGESLIVTKQVLRKLLKWIMRPEPEA